jgi:hypothetical protein
LSSWRRCCRADGVALEQVGHADDGVHRGADLVAHVGQEGALGLVGRLGGLLGGGQFGGALGHHVLSWFWNLSRARSSSLWRVMSLHMVDR